MFGHSCCDEPPIHEERDSEDGSTDDRGRYSVPILAAVGCGDEKPTAPPDLSAWDPPAVGQGFQLVTDETVVPYGTEEQDCYFFRVGDLAAAAGLDATRAVNLHRVQIAQRPGSHHMNIFRVRTVVNLGPDGGAVQRGQDGTGEFSRAPTGRIGRCWPIPKNRARSTGRFPRASPIVWSRTNG